MRVFKTKSFARYMHKEGMLDDKLVEAVREIDKGLVEADYGGGMFKKRIAREGAGKSGGYRSIIAYRSDDRCLFFFIFAKNERENLTEKEQKAFRAAAAVYLRLSDTDIAIAVKNLELSEVEYYEKKI